MAARAAPVEQHDHECIARCVSGSGQAWRELYLELYPQTIRTLLRFGVPAEEADDIGQEVFLQVFRYLGRFEGRATLRTWVYKLCVSQASRFRRSPAARFRALLNGDPPDRGTAELTWSEVQMAREVRRALGRLRWAERQVLVLYEFEDLSCDEIARILECSVAAVWKRLHQARNAFKSMRPLRTVTT